MDPVSIAILSAITAGVTAGGSKVVEKAIVDNYEALKSLIGRKLGSESEAMKAIANLEVKPESRGRRETLQEEIQTAKIDQDAEIHKSAEVLLSSLKAHPAGQTIVTQVVNGDKNIFSGTGDVNIRN